MFNLVYNSTANSQSPPFYDYLTDELYVGDDGGKFWKATGVFNGTPALAAGNWASGISIGSSHKLNGPVLDFSTKNIFAGDDAGGMNYWRDTGSTAGSCSAPCFGSRMTTDTVRPSSSTTVKASLEHERSTAIAYPRVPIARKSSIMGECENSDFVRELQIHNMKWESSYGYSTEGQILRYVALPLVPQGRFSEFDRRSSPDLRFCIRLRCSLSPTE